MRLLFRMRTCSCPSTTGMIQSASVASAGVHGLSQHAAPPALDPANEGTWRQAFPLCNKRVSMRRVATMRSSKITAPLNAARLTAATVAVSFIDCR